MVCHYTGLPGDQIAYEARCSEQIGAICTQLEEFGAMLFVTARKKTRGCLSEVKSNGRVIIEGANAWKGRPSAKGKFWELRTTATKPPGVTLVNMVMYKELLEKLRVKQDRYVKRKKDEAQGRANRLKTNTNYIIIQYSLAIPSLFGSMAPTSPKQRAITSR